MAIPGNIIISPAIPAAFLAPDSTDTSAAESLELGGVALNDGSQGRQVQNWRGYIAAAGTQIRVQPQASGTPDTLLYTGVNITAVSLAFDSNMQPTVAFVEDGVAKLRWFDAVGSAFVVTSYPGVTNPKVSSDDKRFSQVGASDVIFSYINAGTLYWRQQRDRYLVERAIGAVPAGFRLVTMGMNALGRMQWRLVSP